MATTKNLCAQIPIALHERVSEERERLGQTTSEYIANLIQDYAGVTGDLKFRHSTLTQFHDTLSQFQLHSAALGIFLVKAPRKSHGMLAYDRTTVLFFHIPTSFYVVYWLTICILTAAIFRVNRNVSYKHTK